MPSEKFNEMRSQLAADIGVDLPQLVERIRVASEEAGINRAKLDYLEDMRKVVLQTAQEEANKELTENLAAINKHNNQVQALIAAEKDKAKKAVLSMQLKDAPRVTDSRCEAIARKSEAYMTHLLGIREAKEEQARLDAEMYRLRNHYDAVIEMMRFRRSEIYSLHAADLSTKP